MDILGDFMSLVFWEMVERNKIIEKISFNYVREISSNCNIKFEWVLGMKIELRKCEKEMGIKN